MRDGIAGIYGPGVLAIALAYHTDHGWLTAVGEGMMWPVLFGEWIYSMFHPEILRPRVF
jgi:hypothetical protein